MGDFVLWILVLAALVSYGGSKVGSVVAQPNPTPSTVDPSWSVSTAQRDAALKQLSGLKVLPARPDVPGYERGCGTGQGCSFGPAWTDDNTISGTGHNGCGTRDDVLRAQMTKVTTRDGSRCVVQSGTLNPDPYTGRVINWTKTNASAVQVDHIYPLSRAWDFGAAYWPLDKKINFANDTTANLLAADGPANSSKGDKGPGEWMPVSKAYACSYAVKYTAVAAKYALPITGADKTSLNTALGTC